MNILVLLIFASLSIATVFLLGFIWAVRSGQFEDTSTPSMRLLIDEAQSPPTGKGVTVLDHPAKIEPLPANGRIVGEATTSNNRAA